MGTLVIDGHRLKAHSAILAARSEVFDRELNSNMRESHSRVIEIKDADTASFELFLEFLYTDDLNLVMTALKKLIDSKVSNGSALSRGDQSRERSARATILQNILSI